MNNKKPSFGRFAKNKKDTADSQIDIDALDKIDLDKDTLSNKPLHNSPTNPHRTMAVQKRSPSKSMLILLALLTLGFIGYFLFKLLTPPAPEVVQPTVEPAKPVAAPAPSTQDATTPAADAGQLVDPNDIPNPDDIINAPLPENASLYKEELDKLDDEYSRLTEQEKIGQQQAKLMEELTQKKAEQIELLEKQIAQLEGQGSAAANETPAPATPAPNTPAPVSKEGQ